MSAQEEADIATVYRALAWSTEGTNAFRRLHEQLFRVAPMPTEVRRYRGWARPEDVAQLDEPNVARLRVYWQPNERMCRVEIAVAPAPTPDSAPTEAESRTTE